MKLIYKWFDAWVVNICNWRRNEKIFKFWGPGGNEKKKLLTLKFYSTRKSAKDKQYVSNYVHIIKMQSLNLKLQSVYST